MLDCSLPKSGVFPFHKGSCEVLVPMIVASPYPSALGIVSPSQNPCSTPRSNKVLPWGWLAVCVCLCISAPAQTRTRPGMGGSSLELPAQANASPTIVTKIPIASNANNFISVNPGLDKIYVSGGASSGEDVQEIDGATYAVTTLGAGSGASVDTTTNNVWAAGVYGADALVYSGSTGSLVKTVVLGDCPVVTSYDAIAGRAWVGAQCGSNNDPTYAVNGSTYAIEAGPIGSGAIYSYVIVNPATGRAYVEASSLSLRIDPANSFAQTTNSFGFVGAVDATNNLLFAIPGGVGTTLQIVNGQPDPETIQKTVTLPFSASAGSLAADPAAGTLFLGDAAANSIQLVDELTGAVTGQISLGSGNTAGNLAVDPTRDILYAIVQTGSGAQVWVISNASGGTSAAATPTFNPSAGTYTSVQSVIISDTTPNSTIYSTIYYTTDGSAPTTSSTQYSSAISVASSETIQAIAVATGYSTSPVASAAYVINLPAAATPTFNPPDGTYTSVQPVTISDTTTGASIYYTTDGTTPTPSSAKYTGAISVGTTQTIQAIAVASGYATSAVAFATFTIDLPLPGIANKIPISTSSEYAIAVNPVLNKIYVSGGASSGQNVQEIDGSTYAVTTLGTGSGASVDTTTNNVWAAGVYGADALVYSGSTGSLVKTVALGDCPVITSYDSTAGRAWVGAQCGSNNDPTYAVNGSTYAMEAGPIGSGAIYSRVIANPATGRAYVQAGSKSLRIDPGNSFAQTTNAFGFVGAVDATNNLLFAIPSNAFNFQIVNGKPDPEVILKSFPLSFAASAAEMAVNPTTGRLYLSNASGNSIAIQDEQSSNAIGTINLAAGNSPGALAVDPTRNILYAIVQTGSGPQVWVIPDGAQPTAATPIFTPGAGTYTSVQSVTISDATANSTIYYTTDGSTPTTSSTQYSGAISVGTSETLQAIATAAGDANSPVASAAYTINLPAAPTPTFSPAAGTYTSTQSVTISDTAPSPTIYYTTDGSTPTTSSTQSNGAITVNTTETIQAIATGTGFSSSAVASAAYTINLPPPNFTFGASPGSLTVNSGSSGNITLTVTPQNGFNAAVTFACSGLPTGATCSFSPATVTPTGSAAVTTQLTIAASASASAARPARNPFLPAAGLALAGCLLAFTRRRALRLWLVPIASFAVFGAISACGGGGSNSGGGGGGGGTQPTTATVTVTAASGSINQSTKITLTVN